MSLRTFFSVILIILVSAVAAVLFNEIVLDAQYEQGTGQTLDCRDPSAFWANFERCEGQEEHLFWVAGFATIVAGGTASLVHRHLARSWTGAFGSRITWVALAAIGSFAGVVAWGLFYEIDRLPPDLY